MLSAFSANKLRLPNLNLDRTKQLVPLPRIISKKKHLGLYYANKQINLLEMSMGSINCYTRSSCDITLGNKWHNIVYTQPILLVF